MEEGTTEAIFRQARHPYTHALINAEPRPDPHTERQRKPVEYGEAIFDTSASQVMPLTGCVFAGRCAYAQTQCRSHEPPLQNTNNSSKVACFFPLETSTSV